MASVSSGNRGVSRVLTKLEKSLETGNFYEAHQMYRTIYFRYLAQKKYNELLELLYKGALTLLNNDQLSSGTDLGVLVVDTLNQFEVEDPEQWIKKICVLLNKIGPNVVEREAFMVKAIKWSSDILKTKVGHPMMHKLIAQIMWSEGNLEQARHHFLLSKDGAACGKILIQISQEKGYSNEIDLFVAQVVMQQLCLKDKSTAAKTFETYTKYHPKIACTEPPFYTPLLNFIFFLLKAIETGKLIMFKTLCDLYKTSIERDPSYEKYLQNIGVIFFGAQPLRQQSHSNGLFGDLLNQLFQGLDEDDDPPAQQQQSRHGNLTSTSATNSRPNVPGNTSGDGELD